MKQKGGGSREKNKKKRRKFKTSYLWLEKQIILALDSYDQHTQNVKKNRFTIHRQ